MKIPKFVPCEKCNDGYIVDEESGTVKKCDCLVKHQEKVKLTHRFKKANIPHSMIDYDIDSYIGPDKNNNIGKLKKFIDEFEDKFYNQTLYFFGESGTQKTTVSYWVGRELIKKDITVEFILMNDLIKMLTNEGFDDDIDISPYDDCDLLIIDRAFVKEQVTIYKSGYQIPFLDNFLRRRIDVSQNSTIIISNAHWNMISKNFNPDIEDLIRRKVYPYDNTFFFEDHYTIKDNFDSLSLWD